VPSSRAAPGRGHRLPDRRFIEGLEVIKTILQHLMLWDIRSRSLAKAHAPPSVTDIFENSNPTEKVLALVALLKGGIYWLNKLTILLLTIDEFWYMISQ